MKIRLISDNEDTRTGLRLAGVDGAVAHTRDEFSIELNNALLDRDIGIVAVSEKLSKQFHDLIEEIENNRALPLIVEVPDRHGTEREKDFLSGYVRGAIGMKFS
jgi:V/A-type H+-transporting ATPase subunit F